MIKHRVYGLNSAAHAAFAKFCALKSRNVSSALLDTN